MQYWFFYPWNDGGNNHEGDWEHINVVVSPLHAVHRNLTAEEWRTLGPADEALQRTCPDGLLI